MILCLTNLVVFLCFRDFSVYYLILVRIFLFTLKLRSARLDLALGLELDYYKSKSVVHFNLDLLDMDCPQRIEVCTLSQVAHHLLPLLLLHWFSIVIYAFGQLITQGIVYLLVIPYESLKIFNTVMGKRENWSAIYLFFSI